VFALVFSHSGELNDQIACAHLSGVKQWNILTDDIKECKKSGDIQEKFKDMTGEVQAYQH